MRVRSGRFKKSARSTKLSGGVALCFDPQVFHADHPALLNARYGHFAATQFGRLNDRIWSAAEVLECA
jgi:hypothetical protein